MVTGRKLEHMQPPQHLSLSRCPSSNCVFANLLVTGQSNMLDDDQLAVSDNESFRNEGNNLYSVNAWVTAAAVAVCSACALWNSLQVVVERDDEASNGHAATENIDMLIATDMGKRQRDDIQPMQKRSH
ncbi:uncharacterized protein LOC135428148 [Drosophila montana]|uniref:uncharacterized protein LOC135428148 n=1 Tax=Drosophila montana TaxID=40370 RepID=UPI00313DB891